MKQLELKVPPLAVFFITCCIMWGVSKLTTTLTVTIPYQGYLIALLFLIAFIFGAGGLLAFARNKTTIDPLDPEKVSTLVYSGVYNYTRNPMYFALLLTTILVGVYLGNIPALFFIPLFPLYMTTFQIKPEEKVLLAKFGEEYRQYTLRVRRWI